MTSLRDVWEETSFMLELRQANNECVHEEQSGLRERKEPAWKLSFDPEDTILRSLGLYRLSSRSLRITSFKKFFLYFPC